jgi:hypothetical protein
MRLKRLKDAVGSKRVRSELNGAKLAQWGLAATYHGILVDEVRRVLNDRNGAVDEKDKLSFEQCFHFRYKDGQRMLTVGGTFLNHADRQRLGNDPFIGLPFIRTGEAALEIVPPMLTSREVRHLNSLLPHPNPAVPAWLSDAEWKDYQGMYRYYPIFAESEL